MEATTGGYVVGNLCPMAKGRKIDERPAWHGRTAEQRRRTFLQQHRKAKRWSQTKVANELNTTKATISRIENGEIPYSQDFLEVYADLLGVHPAALLSQPPQEPPQGPPAAAQLRRRRR